MVKKKNVFACTFKIVEYFDNILSVICNVIIIELKTVSFLKCTKDLRICAYV